MKYFLSHRFDERDGTLARGAHPIPITRKAAGVLRCLIAHAGTIVPHDTILATVWPDTHVQPDNVKVLVRELRRALDDDSQTPRYIRSEAGRGYAFVAPLADAPMPSGDGADLPVIHANRHDELLTLAGALTAAARDDCRIVAIEGERGMGKTALCEAFLQYAAALPSVRTCYGQCLPHGGAGEPYFPLLDALHHLTRQSPAAIEPLLARHAPFWRASLRPWLADGPGASGGLIADPLRVVRELSALLEALAVEATTILVLDDLQWSDPETVDLLHALARRRARLRTLIVVAQNPFISPARAGGAAAAELWPGPRCTRLALSPLQEADVLDYVVSRFGNGEVELLVERLCRLTAGNPLALVATADALVFTGVIWRDGAGWRVRLPMFRHIDALPRSVRDALSWRFAQLGADARALLERAALLGPTFSAEDVAAAACCAAADVAPALDALCAQRYIRRLAHPSLPAARFGFVHPFHMQLLARPPQAADRTMAGAVAARRMPRCG